MPELSARDRRGVRLVRRDIALDCGGLRFPAFLVARDVQAGEIRHHDAGEDGRQALTGGPCQGGNWNWFVNEWGSEKAMGAWLTDKARGINRIPIMCGHP